MIRKIISMLIGSPRHHNLFPPKWIHVFYCLMLSGLSLLHSQQVADTSYNPPIPDPAYEDAMGPVIFIDEGHHNFHTRDGRYAAFARLLERDGYVVRAYPGTFERVRLEEGKVLIISNALHESNVSDWYLPNPSAFTVNEIRILKEWVRDGGSLFLIADHMPLAGASADLGAAFGFEFSNGFVFHEVQGNYASFIREDGSLHDNIITNGRVPSEKVDKVVTFTGQAFRTPEDAHSVLTFDNTYSNLLPDTAWVFTDSTPSLPVAGWAQGAFMDYGKGRIVVFGEAAMFSAQLAGPQKIKMGMNNAMAQQNYQLLLNIIHWLDRLL